MDMACPECGSQQTQTVSMAYAAGTSRGRTVGMGIAAVGDGLMPAMIGGKTRSQTDLARRLAPPLPRVSQGGWAGLAGILLAGMTAATMHENGIPADQFLPVAVAIVLASIVLAVWMGMRARAYNGSTHRKLMDQWNASWVCLRCGQRWRPDAKTGQL
jgi:DNA-directed RNA polymerase subunit RPC12/RpoP